MHLGRRDEMSNEQEDQAIAKARIQGLKNLRDPFLPAQISKLPKPMLKREQMDAIPKAMCKVCHTYHATDKVMHLDYVGHAATTARLLDVDPFWNWEPVAYDEAGLPKRDALGGLWIKLTVCGVTRLGYGNAEGKSGGDSIKEIIGDAIRNAAMRFGCALDLWHKGDAPLFTPDPWTEDEKFLAQSLINDFKEDLAEKGLSKEQVESIAMVPWTTIGTDISYNTWFNRFTGYRDRQLAK